MAGSMPVPTLTADVHQQKLELKRQKFQFEKELAEEMRRDKAEALAREVNYKYLVLTVVILLTILVIFWLTKRFGFGVGAGIPPPAQQPAGGSERFSPYASILNADNDRTDSSFDYQLDQPYKSTDPQVYSNMEFNANAQAMSSEDKLANQLWDLIL
jgi:hypothetical protein